MKKRVARGGFVPEGKDEAEEPTVVIYITRAAYNRLQGGGTWYEKSCYSVTPSEQFPVKTRVPESALAKGFFYPDRCECGPDDIAERCEEVPLTVPTKLKFRAGQEVWSTLTGAGTESYKKCTVQRVRKGEVWLDGGPGNDPSGPFDEKTGEYRGDTIFGFSRKITVEKPKDAKDK